jgi:hypothetical protein
VGYVRLGGPTPTCLGLKGLVVVVVVMEMKLMGFFNGLSGRLRF